MYCLASKAGHEPSIVALLHDLAMSIVPCSEQFLRRMFKQTYLLLRPCSSAVLKEIGARLAATRRVTHTPTDNTRQTVSRASSPIGSSLIASHLPRLLLRWITEIETLLHHRESCS